MVKFNELLRVLTVPLMAAAAVLLTLVALDSFDRNIANAAAGAALLAVVGRLVFIAIGKRQGQRNQRRL
jgi:hypothetical protein